MIPHSSAGVQSWGHPVRNFDNISGRADSSHDLHPSDHRPDKQRSTPILPPQTGQPAFIDLTSNTNDAQEREPPAKRLRLDLSAGSLARDRGSPATITGGEPRATPGTTNSKPSALSWRGRPVWSFQSMISEATGGREASGAGDKRPASPPSLPHPPWKVEPPEQLGSSAAIEPEPSPVTNVQTTPFRLEVPPVAPAFNGDSEWPRTVRSSLSQC